MGRKKKNNVVRAYKHLLERDFDWDFYFLLVLERKKIKRMLDYFSHSEITCDDSLIARDLKICIRLLDITLDDEKATNVWGEKAGEMLEMVSHKIPGEDLYTLDFKYNGMIPDFPKYVNTRNWKRFRPEISYPSASEKKSPEERKWDEEHFKEGVREAKAWHLYNLIREYRLFSWWD